MPAYDSSLIRILRCFSQTNTLGFTELAEHLQLETDLTGYYLRKLQRRELVEKIDRGRYRITPLGKSILAHARLLSGLTIEPRVSIMLVLSVVHRYVLTKRTAQPYIGKIEWPTAPLLAGEPSAVAAYRVAQLRLGLDIQPCFHGFFRRVDTQNATVFDDKLFAIHRLSLSEATAKNLTEQNEVGETLQMTKQAMLQLPNRSRSLLDILEFTQNSSHYSERTYELAPADLY